MDILVRRQKVTRFPGRRRPGTARGTGCRLASAIAGLLARGESLEDAIRGARAVVEAYLDHETRLLRPTRRQMGAAPPIPPRGRRS